MTTIATVIFALGICTLFVLDREPEARTSRALWLSMFWLLIAASRNISEWLSVSGPAESSDSGDAGIRYLDGNPVDRFAMTAILALGVLVLVARRRQAYVILRANLPIVAFFSYCAISSLWSEHTDVALKRWSKALGDWAMVLVVLTDPNRLAATKRFFARTGFVLLPLSILFIRYYSDIGRAYSPWNGDLSYTGVTTSKNLLGTISMIFGLASLWRLLGILHMSPGRRRSTQLIVHCTIITTALWLVRTADSMTSLSCFVLAGGVMVWASRPMIARKPALIHAAVVGVLAVAFSTLFLNINSGLIENLGRNSSLTGRTEIWSLVISMIPNRLLGAGFESYWVGERLQKIWNLYWNHPNQAHNGYLEIYLNLGWLGIVAVSAMIVGGYRSIMHAIRRHSPESTLRLGCFLAALIYNFTESAFKMTHPVWIAFLMAITFVPESRPQEQSETAVANEPYELLAETHADEASIYAEEAV